MNQKDRILEKFVEEYKYTKKHIEGVLVNLDLRIINPPTKFRKGDVIKLLFSGKPRPGVIVKVLKDRVYAIPLTSSDNIHKTIPYTSRFFGQGWFCDSLISVKIEVARENFYGIFDSPEEVNNAIAEIRKIAYLL